MVYLLYEFKDKRKEFINKCIFLDRLNIILTDYDVKYNENNHKDYIYL